MKDESNTTKQTWSTTPSDGGSSRKNQKTLLIRRSTNLTLTSGFYSNDSSGDSEGGTNIWTRLLSRPNSKAGNSDRVGDDDDSINSFGACYDDEELNSRHNRGSVISSGCSEATSTFKVSAAAMLSTLRHHPMIPIISVITFGICLAIGLSFIEHQSAAYQQNMLDTATRHATESMEWFSDEFDKALAPLFALSQVVKHDEELCELAQKIGNRGELNAMPGWPEDMDLMASDPENYQPQEYMKRDVRSVCDDTELLDRFGMIADSVKKDSGLGDVITGLRVAPAGVMCMIHPLINYDDYSYVHPNQTTQIAPYYNGTKMLYADWAWGKPSRVGVLRKTMQVQEAEENRITITGPFKMKSAGGDGTILTETLFCTHLGVSVPNHTLTMIGDGKDVPPETYESWGFVMGFVNWQRMVDQSRISQRFHDMNMVYMLNRTFAYEDTETGEEVVQTDSIAWTHDRCVTTTDPQARIQVSSTVNGDDWILTAGYTCAVRPSWETAAIIAIVLVSFVIAVLVLATLVKNQQHKNLLFKMMPKRAISKLNKGQTVVEKYSCVTIFFSDIVGFTSMAGEMTPVQVMKMLNALYNEFDKIVAKHNCYKVETIGDAYMVVGGAPDRVSRSEAAKKVALFALDALECVKTFRTPEGTRINIRAGIASGAVVAGVVGSVMPRYCLFGDTVNFASRMESTSKKNKIQVCSLTRSLLVGAQIQAATEKTKAQDQIFQLEARKDSNSTPQGTMVKGMGWRETWWLVGTRSQQDSSKKTTAIVDNAVPLELDLVSFGHEEVSTGSDRTPSTFSKESTEKETNEAIPEADFLDIMFSSNEIHDAMAAQRWDKLGHPESAIVAATDCRETHIIRASALLEYHLLQVLKERDANAVMSPTVKAQCRKFVQEVTKQYNGVNFHNLSHAMHVTTSMNKLLSCTVVEDPLNSFSLVFASLLHDAGHTGMSNKILRETKHPLTEMYKQDQVPIAEKHSIDIALELLFLPEFDLLRLAIIPDTFAKIQFAKTLFQSVLVTDIASPDRVKLGVERFNVAQDEMGEYECRLCPLAPYLQDLFEGVGLGESAKEEYPDEFVITHKGLQKCVRNEHLMLLSDISHLTQGWNNFIKWNYRLYLELFDCWKKGLCEDPREGWFNGQIGFLDHYILPLVIRSQTYFDKEFADALVANVHSNRKHWIECGVKATQMMVSGAENNEDEGKVLMRLYELPSLGSSRN